MTAGDPAPAAPAPAAPSVEDVYRLLGERLGRPAGLPNDELEPSRHAPLFRAHAVFRVRTTDFDAFPYCRLAHSGRSVGLCACDGKRLTYLHANEPVALGEVLAREGAEFFTAARPEALAELFAELLSVGLRALPSVQPEPAPSHEAGKLTFVCDGLPTPADQAKVEVHVPASGAPTFTITRQGPAAPDDDDIRLF